jgi:F0F1-type ATP synthase membrane subunit c/vacuolar-type H+-ATPase subunit K
MPNIARAAGLLVFAAACFVCAIAFGVRGASAHQSDASAPASVCCIYMIF